MKIEIQESGEETGWYDLETDEYEYDGDNNVIGSILERAEGFTELEEINIDQGETEIVGGEVWTASSQHTKLEQIKNLVEPFDDVSIVKSSGYQVVFVEDKVVQKRRIYVDHPDEAPDWATVEEGDRDGLYYETQSSVDEGIPRFLNPDYAESSESIRESSDDRRGRYASTMQVHHMSSGRKVYSKSAEPAHMIGEFMSDKVLESLGLEAPAVAYDPEEGKVYKEGIEGGTLAQLSGNTEMGVEMDRRPVEEYNRESYIEQIAAMIITGNSDLNAGNMVADSDGDFWIVDHDALGKRNLGHNPWEASPITEAAIHYADNIGMDVSKEEIKQQVREIASNAVDDEGNIKEEVMQGFNEAAQHNIDDRGKGVTESIMETLQMNIMAAYNQELEWTH